MSTEVSYIYPESTMQDTYVLSSSVSNFANNIFLKVGKDSSNAIARSILKNDFSNTTVPSNAYLEKASVKLVCQSGGFSSIGVYEIISDWNEISNWSNQPTYVPSPIYTYQNINYIAGQKYEFEFTDLARFWLDSRKVNRGFALRVTDTLTINQITFFSSSYINSWERPEFYYKYKPGNKKQFNPILNESTGGVIIL